jgi:lipid II:glycine glycyltransferase (peptidoglycan interpeptide bridge formation enzyme)
MTLLTTEQWDAFLERYPNAHILQTSAWGAFKSRYGWQAVYVADHEAGAQILLRRLPLGLSIAYLPKGPLGSNWTALLPEITEVCREHKAIAIYVEPDAWQLEAAQLDQALPGFALSDISIQPRKTITISLEGTEEEWLARMKQKTRYNIRLAEKKEVQIVQSDDLDAFNRLMQTTGARDEFGVHPGSYYRAVYDLFHPCGACELFMATYQGQPLAAIMAFKRGNRAWYFYGASNDQERNRMPTYLLQWEAMRWAAQAGCTEYDLWGVPDADEETLEAQFAQRSDGLWGVYRFKRGFGGVLKRTAGVYVKILHPGLYRLYLTAMKIRKNGLVG